MPTTLNRAAASEILGMFTQIGARELFWLTGAFLAVGASITNRSSKGPVLAGTIPATSVRDALFTVHAIIAGNLEQYGMGEANETVAIASGAINWMVSSPGYISTFIITPNF